MDAREAEVAWAAGFFEGEGCLSHFAHRHIPRASVSSTDRDVLQRFNDVVLVGRIEPHGLLRVGRKAIWRWTANSDDAVAVIKLLLPHLGVRRATRARELLRYRDERIEAVTAPRECVGCRALFRPAYSPNSTRQKHCTVACYEQTTGRVNRRLAERRRNPHWKAKVTP